MLSPCRQLASGSGDTTVRFWDVFTETPLHTCRAHKHWILCIAWSPDGKRLASGCKNGQVEPALLCNVLVNFDSPKIFILYILCGVLLVSGCVHVVWVIVSIYLTFAIWYGICEYDNVVLSCLLLITVV